MYDYITDFAPLRRAVIDRDFSRMNDRQRDAVYHTDGPLLILAGAGSGKTTVLVNRIANLIKYGSGYRSQTLPDGITEEDVRHLRALRRGAYSRRRIRAAPVPRKRLSRLAYSRHHLYKQGCG